MEFCILSAKRKGKEISSIFSRKKGGGDLLFEEGGRVPSSSSGKKKGKILPGKKKRRGGNLPLPSSKNDKGGEELISNYIGLFLRLNFMQKGEGRDSLMFLPKS